MTEREVSSERLPDRCPHCDLHWGYNPPAMIAGTDNVRCIECKTVFVKFPVSSERVSHVNRLASDLTGVRLTPFHTHKSLRELIAYAREMATELLALRSSVKTVENDPHRFVVVSADYSRPFLAGAYPKLENALKAQCGSPEKWHIFERYAIEAPAGEGEAEEGCEDCGEIGYSCYCGLPEGDTSPSAPIEVTEEMVERAAKAMASKDGNLRNWQLYVPDARAALTAALKGGR